MTLEPKLSVIIPTFNEMKLGILPKIIQSLQSMVEIEILISDGGSTDGTLAFAYKSGLIVLNNQTSSRAQRLNWGAHKANSSMLLFHHPRSLIDPVGIEYLKSNAANLFWGGFTHQFDDKHPLLKFTSWYSNEVRSKICEIFYLDHCLFVQKKLFEEIGPILNVDIFEDTLLSLALQKTGKKPDLLPFYAQTSAIRFKEGGIYKQALQNQYLKLAFKLGLNHKKLNKYYEKKLHLNANYE